jgi:hypothetical protein
MMAEEMEPLVELLIETRKAHHLAYQDTDGEDPEWPMWYADYMIDRLQGLLHAPLTRSELVCVLLNLSRIQPLEAPDEPWQEYYARYLLERYHH